MRSSSRIRKQRIDMRQEYLEEEDVEDPFADNSDVDSNYSFRVKRNHRKSGKGYKNHNKIACLRGSSTDTQINLENETSVEQNTVSYPYRIEDFGRNRRVISEDPIPVKGARDKRKKRAKSRPAQRKRLHGDLIDAVANAPMQCSTTSIPRLNKNGLTRGADGTRVGAGSHWFSLNGQFKVGKFLMYKRDKPLLTTTKLSLWRIDSKSLLQKFEAFVDASERDCADKDAGTRTIKFKAIKVYGGWSPLRTEEFALVPIKAVLSNAREENATGVCVVQIDSNQVIDIDSDE